MGRWEPDSRQRLEQAALELYAERGFDDTTVAQIAERAGLTERTFFRHFEDKREMLFGGAGALQDLLVGAVADAPAEASPLEAVAVALDAVVALGGGVTRPAEETPYGTMASVVDVTGAPFRLRQTPA